MKIVAAQTIWVGAGIFQTVGQRRMFFLEPANGVLRSVGCDRLHLDCQRQTTKPQCLQRQNDDGLLHGSLLLMTSGTTLNPDIFRLDMMKSIYVTDVLCSISEADVPLAESTSSQ